MINPLDWTKPIQTRDGRKARVWDKPEYRWLVAECYGNSGWNNTTIQKTYEQAEGQVKSIVKYAAGHLSADVYIIDLHQLTPVAVTGSAGDG